jgi:hypothetical protein
MKQPIVLLGNKVSWLVAGEKHFNKVMERVTGYLFIFQTLLFLCRAK